MSKEKSRTGYNSGAGLAIVLVSVIVRQPVLTVESTLTPHL